MPDFQYYEDLPRGFHASLAQLTTVHPHTDIPRGQRLGYYDLTPAPTEIAPVARLMNLNFSRLDLRSYKSNTKISYSGVAA